ncbi:MAG TPA: TonB-dependent receptor [Thermoanaerobaculia bacterium]|nr:TonB-dependent receptor [Thermoanaerobaculia bacterium]
MRSDGTVRRFALLLTFATFASALPAWAQASLEVTLRNASNDQPVAGAEVRLANPAIGFTTTGVTNGQGKVRFPSLPTAGEYALTAPQSADFEEGKADGINLRTNFDRSVTLSLAPRKFTESITVKGEEGSLAAVNTVNGEVSSTLQQRDVEMLPIEGRDVTRVLYRLPNVTQATGFYPEAPNVSINGANSLYANYMLDGLDNDENFLGGEKFAVPVGFTQDVTVLTAAYSAEFGRTGNGIINVTTRSGGNELRGELFYLTRPGSSVDASSPFAGRDLSGNAVQDGFARQQGGASLGGALKRDRTFYFLNAESTRDSKDNLLRVPELGINETVPGKNRFTYISGKLDQRWSDALTSVLRVNVGDVSVERQGGGLDGGVTFPSAGSIQDRDSRLYAFKNSYVHEDFVAETNVQYGSFRWNYGRPENGASPQVSVLGADGQTVAVLGHPGFVFDDLEKTWQGQQKATFLRDNHTLKVGAEIVTSDFALAGGGNVNGNYLVQLTAAQEAALRARNLGAGLSLTDIPADVKVLDYNVELHPETFGERQTIYSGYVEDLWSASSRLSLTAGLRYDYDSLSKGGGDQGDRNNFAPRLSLNYQLDQKSSVRAGFGIFYDKILYSVYSDALQQNSTSAGFIHQLQELVALGILPRNTDFAHVTFPGNISADLPNVPYLGGPGSAALQGQRETVVSNELRILNPDGYQNPRTDQYTLGYQRQIASDKLFYVDLIHTRSSNLFRLRNLNAPAPYPVTDPNHVVVRTPEEADATRPVALVPGGARNIVITETEGEARYTAANFTLLRERFDGKYSWRLSYTWSRLRNDTDDINFRAADANDYAAEWGPSLNDRTHVINGLLQLFPWKRLSLSLAALLQSGQPINRIPDARIYGTTDLNGDGRSFGDAYDGNSDRYPGASRNSDRLPWSYVFDLGAQYRLPLAGHDVELRVDVFNLFNRTNLSGYSNNATQSNQIQIGPPGGRIVEKNAGPPRQFQFGVRYVF